MHSYYPRNHTDGTDGYYTSEEVNNSLWGAIENPNNGLSTCGCIAHQNVGNQYTQKDLYALMSIPATMNNDEGKTFIISLVNIILFYADLTTQYSIFATEQGTQYTVNFILIDTVTSEKQSFHGWPDFCITEKSMGAGVLLVSIGEMESRRTVYLNLEPYAVRQFSLESNRRKKLVCVAVYKKSIIQCLILISLALSSLTLISNLA